MSDYWGLVGFALTVIGAGLVGLAAHFSARRGTFDSLTKITEALRTEEALRFARSVSLSPYVLVVGLALMLGGIWLFVSHGGGSSAVRPEQTLGVRKDVGEQTALLREIKQLLEQRLSPPKSVQESSEPQSESASDGVAGWLAWVALGVVGAVVVLVVQTMKSPRRKLLTIIGALSTLVSVGALSFINVENVKLTLFESRFSGADQNVLSIEDLNIAWEQAGRPSAESTLDIRVDLLGTVEGFDSGSEQIATGCAAVEDITENLEKRLDEGYELGILIIAGHTDKRPLHGNLKDRYGSNLTLGQRRAVWVRKCLPDQKIDPKRIVTVSGGAEHLPEGVDDETHAKDRVVAVYAIWTRQNTDDSRESSPE